MYISNIRLRNWKNFKDTGAFLRQRVFLVGPNASGKSNLLDALRFLRDLASEGLELAVRKRGGVSAIRCLAATRYSDIDVKVLLADKEESQVWSYHLAFNQDQARRPIIKNETVINLRDRKHVLIRPDARDADDPLRMTQTALEQVTANKKFREISDYFKTISYQHIVPQVVRDPKGFSSIPVHNDPFGRDFSVAAMEYATKNTQC